MSGAQSSFDAVTGYLLDTNVISETRKSRPDAGVIAFLSAAEGDGLFLSVLTLGELRKGVALKSRADPAAAGRLGAWVEGIATNFEDRILPVDYRDSPALGRIVGEPKPSGH